MEALCFFEADGSSARALDALPLDDDEVVVGVEQAGESLSALDLLLGDGFARAGEVEGEVSPSSSWTACFFFDPAESLFFLESFVGPSDEAVALVDPFRGFAGGVVGEGESVMVGEVEDVLALLPRFTLLLLPPLRDMAPLLPVPVPLAAEEVAVRLELEEEEADVERPGNEECLEAELFKSRRSKMRLHTRVYCHASPLIRLKRTPMR